MFEEILSQISSFPPFWIYVTLFLFAFIENIFPPSPSDFVLIVGGSIAATSTVNVILILIVATLGSITGFMLMFYIGTTVDRKVIHSGKFKFIPVESIGKVETWFQKYGYAIIVANRFLPGTRAVISFFAGISNLEIKKTTVLCFISALAWNAIIIYLGYMFGENVDVVDRYISTYSNIVIVATVLIILLLVLKYFINKKKNKD